MGGTNNKGGMGGTSVRPGSARGGVAGAMASPGGATRPGSARPLGASTNSPGDARVSQTSTIKHNVITMLNSSFIAGTC